MSPRNTRSLWVLKSVSAIGDIYDLKGASFINGCLYTQMSTVFTLPTVTSIHNDSKPFSFISACFSRLCGRSARTYTNRPPLGQCDLRASWCICTSSKRDHKWLTHWGRNKIDAISQTTFSNAISFNENVWIPIKISLKFVPKGRINNIPALVLIMAWRRTGDKPSSEPMIVSLLTHICVTRPQWVKVMTWRLCGLEHLPEPMLTYH